MSTADQIPSQPEARSQLVAAEVGSARLEGVEPDGVVAGLADAFASGELDEAEFERRSIDMVKGTTRFANAEYLESSAADTFVRLLDPTTRLRSFDRETLVERASSLVAALNVRAQDRIRSTRQAGSARTGFG